MANRAVVGFQVGTEGREGCGCRWGERGMGRESKIAKGKLGVRSLLNGMAWAGPFTSLGSISCGSHVPT